MTGNFQGRLFRLLLLYIVLQPIITNLLLRSPPTPPPHRFEMIFRSLKQPPRHVCANKYDLQLRVVQIDFLLEIIAPLKNEGTNEREAPKQ